jgi:hypothetical protein
VNIAYKTFYTPLSKYQDEAAFLKLQLEKWNINVETMSYGVDGRVPERKDDWMPLCLQRAIMLDAMFSQPEWPADTPIGLLDTDLIVCSEPKLMREIPAGHDVLCTDMGHAVASGRRFSAGILAFAPSEQGRKALREWANYCKKGPMMGRGLSEQEYLEWSFTEKSQARRYVLPRTYNKIPDKNTGWTDNVVLHTHDPFYHDLARQFLDMPELDVSGQMEAIRQAQLELDHEKAFDPNVVIKVDGQVLATKNCGTGPVPGTDLPEKQKMVGFSESQLAEMERVRKIADQEKPKGKRGRK